MRSVNIGIIGLGTVGGGVVRLIQRHHDDYVEHYGIDLQIKRACSRNDAEAKNLGIADIFTTNWQDVTSDPTIDIVIELIGGEHPATEIFEDAFAHGKHVVSANKALLGRHVEHLAKLANSHGVQIKCEAAAAGGIPVVSALEHDLVGNEILTIAGIMNGTTNYILSRMANEGLGFDEVLADAQRLGYAEADPTADVDGFDAASKIAILASIGFRTRVNTDDVFMQGIRNVSATDIEMARQFGYAIKLLAIARNTESGVDVRVHPTMIPATHQLASVSGAMNAVFIVGDAVGETMFYGAGAGSFPTASAVVGDVMSLADHIAHGKEVIPESEPFGHNLAIRDIADLETRYYIRLTVADKLGVLAETTKVLADDNISISDINQTKSESLVGAFVDTAAAAAEIGKICNAHNSIDIDFTVILTHIGFEEDKHLARQLDPAWGVDLIIGGHSHTFLEHAVEENGVVIAQAGTGTDQIGRFDIIVDTDGNCIDSYTWRSIPITADNCPRSPMIEHVLERFTQQIDEKYNFIIGRFRRELTHPERTQETELGNLFADIFTESLGVDIMLIGSGSIRSEKLGPIVTYADLIEGFPYDDGVYMFKVTAGQLRKMLLYMVRDEAFLGHTEFYQIPSKFRFCYNRERGEFDSFTYCGKELGREISDDTVFTVGMQNFHFQNVEKFLSISYETISQLQKPRCIASSCQDILMEYFREHEWLDSAVDGRMTIEG